MNIEWTDYDAVTTEDGLILNHAAKYNQQIIGFEVKLLLLDGQQAPPKNLKIDPSQLNAEIAKKVHELCQKIYNSTQMAAYGNPSDLFSCRLLASDREVVVVNEALRTSFPIEGEMQTAAIEIRKDLISAVKDMPGLANDQSVPPNPSSPHSAALPSWLGSMCTHWHSNKGKYAIGGLAFAALSLLKYAFSKYSVSSIAQPTSSGVVEGTARLGVINRIKDIAHRHRAKAAGMLVLAAAGYTGWRIYQYLKKKGPSPDVAVSASAPNADANGAAPNAEPVAPPIEPSPNSSLPLWLKRMCYEWHLNHRSVAVTGLGLGTLSLMRYALSQNTLPLGDLWNQLKMRVQPVISTTSSVGNEVVETSTPMISQIKNFSQRHGVTLAAGMLTLAATGYLGRRIYQHFQKRENAEIQKLQTLKKLFTQQRRTKELHDTDARCFLKEVDKIISAYN